MNIEDPHLAVSAAHEAWTEASARCLRTSACVRRDEAMTWVTSGALVEERCVAVNLETLTGPDGGLLEHVGSHDEQPAAEPTVL